MQMRSEKALRAISFLLAIATHVDAQLVLNRVSVLGGDGSDVVTGMALDALGNSYLSGYTTSFNLATPGSFRSQRSSSNLYSFDAASGEANPLFPPSHSQIVSLSADPGHAGSFYAAATTGLVKTTDGGVTWNALTNGLPTGVPPVAVVVSPMQPGIVYVAYQAETFGSETIYKTADSGLSWTPAAPLPYTPAPPLLTSITGIAVDPFDPNHVYVYGSETFATSDGGTSWTLVPGASGVLLVTFDPAVKGRIYAYTISTPYLTMLRSLDGGQNFSQLPLSMLYFIDCILPDPRHPGTLYVAGSGNSPATTGIFKSTDAGMTWTLASGFQTTKIVVDFSTGTFYVESTEGISISTDELQTFHVIAPLGFIYDYDFIVAKPGTLVVATGVTSEGFVSKLDPDGNVIFTSYLGGLIGSSATAIAVDAQGSIYVAAQTASQDFPQTAALPNATPGFYLMKLSPDGTSLAFSTLVSSTGSAETMTVDGAGSIYVAGTTGEGYPTTANSAQPLFYPSLLLPVSPVHEDGFVTKFAPDGKTLLYSTYFGQAADRAHAMAVDVDGSAYVVGTRLWKLNPSGSALTWSTILPPGELRAAVLDAAGNLYVCGGTFQGNALYTSPNAYQPLAGPYNGPLIDSRFDYGNADAFVAKFSSSGSVIYSTLFGGTSGEAGTALVVDGLGNATVLGTTDSFNLPMLYPLQEAFNGHTGFLAKFNGDGSQLSYSTYLGDARQFDAVSLSRRPDGELLLAGYTSGAAIAPSGPSGNNVFLNVIAETRTVPALYVDHVLNEANISGGPIAPDEWILIRGAGFTNSPDISLGDLPVTVTSFTSSEILARVPASAVPGPARLILREGGLSTSLYIDIVSAAPAFFSRDGTGTGQVLAINADGTLNGPDHPAAIGSAIRIAANGVGIQGANTIQTYFQTGIVSPATVVNAPVPGLPGDTYNLISTTIPNYPYKPGPILVWLELNGVFMESPPLTITVQ
jgi:uncharacterized protein (TIGR03437 family)